ncbi:MAG: phosphate regulon sensor histidine kinase PhoR [Pseudomonadota bacterium]|jgi:two-component system phosphate regulon sensor histidine kinase PhoR
MVHDYWQVEIRRLIAILVLGLIIGYATHYWLLSFLMVSLGYIAWMLFKLRQLQTWLATGQPPESMPDSDGAWEQITYLIHRSKQKSKSRKKKQRETLDRLNNVMAALPDATVLINQDFIIQWSNPAATRLLGIQIELDWGNRLDNLIRSSELHALLAAAETDKKIRLHSPLDDQIILQAHLVSVQKNLFLFNVRDISQGVHLQQTRKAFFANASHELRTPLTVLAGYLELFEDETELPEHLLPAVQQARAQAERMQRIISDMLSLSKLENDEQRRMIETEINVPELLNEIAISLGDTLAADSHSLSLNLDPNLYLLGHEPDLLSVLTNLTDNAIRHTPPDTHIQIDWQQRANGQVCLSVEDNGPGIPAQHIGHLTERFYRVDKGRARDKGGTGLGLAIVKHVMLNHGGSLEITSKAGCTRFTACFPSTRAIRK